ncbi:MAG: hypothetical protein DF168_01130 [Candidatus Moanabacter tarae]|mgnify:CR=1 FL=1|uniref:Haloacid dehalogenase-like hydrolase n=1 Tax=Candidatus Moanibacter tarae TaxID=2200854 RepID=A0A2Z4AQ37_9BACT|nr:MAG: hypothetical protein DF168_01130 [Candidatus Moanabacter tarae]|tara:strand:- start:6119 stop:7138 length:1020 start_codon:yes stop_codon:yes gene_type:complete
MSEKDLHSQNIVACIWDFDKTLIPGFMQSPLFRRFKIDEEAFWKEVSILPEIYSKRGVNVSKDTVYLNHLLSYVRNGRLRGLNNRMLRELGEELVFFPGLPDLFPNLKELVRSRPEFVSHELSLEHYVISTGLAELIRGSELSPHLDGIFGCEFIEDPAPPDFDQQKEFELDRSTEISQIGVMVDNTIKTRFIFEINKGSNKLSEIDVNATIRTEDRRIPIQNMIYVADGPSDVPVFSVVKNYGGLTHAVYDPNRPEEFAQNDRLLQSGRIHAYGPADYRPESSTSMWIRMHILRICDRIVTDREQALAKRVSVPPRHIHSNDHSLNQPESPQQGTFLD